MSPTRSILAVAAASVALASCAGIASSQQNIVVKTDAPGAAVFLAVEGVAIQEVRVPGLISGVVNEREFVRDFGYIGTTPLSYSIPTYGETDHLRIPGQFRTGEERYARAGFVRIEHADGYVEERRFTIRNGELTLSFAGAPDEEATQAQDAESRAR
jgi:hypothetical protein